jgi:hypothetical protein
MIEGIEHDDTEQEKSGAVCEVENAITYGATIRKHDLPLTRDSFR